MYPKTRYVLDYMIQDDTRIKTVKQLLELTAETALKIRTIDIEEQPLYYYIGGIVNDENIYEKQCYKYNNVKYEIIIKQILLCKKLKLYTLNDMIDFNKYSSSFPSLLHVKKDISVYWCKRCYVFQNDVLTILNDRLHCFNKCSNDETCCYKCFVKYKFNTFYYKHLSLQYYHRDYSIINKINKNVKHLTFSTINKELKYNFNFGLKKIRIVCHDIQKKCIKIPFGVKCTLYKK